MLHLTTTILVVVPLLLLYGAIVFNYKRWRYQQKSAMWGCGLPAVHKLRWYGGLDQVKRNFNADKRHRVPAEIEKMCFEELPGTFTSEVRILGNLFLHTIDPENIQAILAKQFDDFELGPTRRGNFWPLLGSGIFTDDGAEWAHSRALLRPQFTRNQVADLGLQERHVQHLFKHLRASQSGWTLETNLQPLFFRLTLDLATEFLFGESVYSQLTVLPAHSRSEEDEVVNESGLDLLEVGRAFDRATHSLGRRFRFGDYYWMYSPKQFKDDCKLIHQFADFFVNRVLERDLEKESNDRYVFLKELAKSTNNPIEIRSQLLNIFLAGRDTTAGLLSWVFWILARHPDIYDKLRGAITNDFGTYSQPRNISFNSLKACSYLQYVMSETLRLYPSVPLNTRYATKDTTIPRGGGPDGKQPVFVPKGTHVDYTVQVMHRRKDIWGEDASEFKPERWIGHKCGWEFLPFNGGPRICLGQQFALTEVGYVIVRILQKFEKIENMSDMAESDPIYQYSITTAPWEVTVKMKEAKE